MCVGLFLLDAIDWHKNPCGIIPVSTVENVAPHLWIAIFLKQKPTSNVKSRVPD